MNSQSLNSSIATTNNNQLFPLPNLTGEYTVGTTSYRFTDSNRIEIFDPSGAGGNREVAIRVWYPGQALREANVAPYIAETAIPVVSGVLSVSPELLASIQPHAFAEVPVITDEESYPVIFLSPGGDLGFLEQYTAQAEELASQGYVVVGMSHTYESLITVFPDGEVIPFNPSLSPTVNPPGSLEELLETRQQLVNVRTADASFVLDQLEQINLNDPQGLLTGILDLDKVGIYGHSLGGVTVTQVLASDPRFDAGLSLDSDPIATEGMIEGGIDEPYMVISDPGSINTINPEAFFTALGLDNDGYSITIAGIGHGNFSDVPLLLPILETSFSREQLQVGSLDPLLSTEVTNAYIRAFFDRHLLNLDSPLFEGAVPEGISPEAIDFVTYTPPPALIFGSPEADVFMAETTPALNHAIAFSGAGTDEINLLSTDERSSQGYGGSDGDELIAGTNDRLFGGDGHDLLDASEGGGGNRLYGGDGDDEFFAGSNDRLFGGDGRDTFNANVGKGGNSLYGGDGDDDFILGKRDRAIGGEGLDRFFVLEAGDNLLTGGVGADQFWLATGGTLIAEGQEANVITDFETGVDILGFGGDFGVNLNEFADLTISTSGDNTTINALGRDIAILLGVNELNVSDVTFVPPLSI
jgi:hypothetical protein